MLAEPSDRVKAYALTQLERAIVCLGWRGSRAHAGVHQARKSIRRVRACLALGESALGAGADMIDRELAKICESLSCLRDAKARVESLDRLLTNNTENEIQHCLQAAKRLALNARANAMRIEQAMDPNFLTRRERLQVLEAAIPVLPWKQISHSGLSRAIHHSMYVCDQAAVIALSRGKSKDWHRLRRRRRRLAQQHTALEHCDILLPSILVPDHKLGSLLGEAQDISVLREFFKKHPNLSIENAARLKVFLKQEFKHLSTEAMGKK